MASFTPFQGTLYAEAPSMAAMSPFQAPWEWGGQANSDIVLKVWFLTFKIVLEQGDLFMVDTFIFKLSTS